MPTEEEIDEVIDTFRGYSETIGDEFKQNLHVEYETDDGEYIAKGFTARDPSNDCIYNIIAREDVDTVIIRYGYDLIEHISDSIDQTEVRERIGTDFAEDSNRDAAIKLMKQIDDRDLDRLVFHLYESLLDANVVSTVERNEDGIIESFAVYRHFFPYDEGVSLKEFYNSAIAVTSIGEQGARYLRHSFSIGVPEDPDGDIRLSFRPEDIPDLD